MRSEPEGKRVIYKWGLPGNGDFGRGEILNLNFDRKLLLYYFEQYSHKSGPLHPHNYYTLDCDLDTIHRQIVLFYYYLGCIICEKLPLSFSR